MKWLGFEATNLSHATKLTGSKLANKPTNTQLFILCVSGMCFIMNWIDKNKQMPPIGEFEDVSVYVHVTNGKLIGHGTYNYDRKVWTYHMTTWSEQDDNEITHWMPLLKLPSEI